MERSQSAGPQYASQYRQILRDQLVLRCARNPRYSQRAFARDLGVAPNRLSEVLGSRYGISRSLAVQFAARMGLGTEQASYFCDLVEAAHGRSRAARLAATERLMQRTDRFSEDRLSEAQFRALRDWYHLAILELANTKSFRWDARHIAGRLGISVSQAKCALKNLQVAKLIEKAGRSWRVIKKRNFVESVDFSEAVREFHHQMLTLASASIHEQSATERELQSLLVALSGTQRAAVMARMRALIAEVASEVAHSTTAGKDEVYSLSMQLFRVSRRNIADDSSKNIQ